MSSICNNGLIIVVSVVAFGGLVILSMCAKENLSHRLNKDTRHITPEDVLKERGSSPDEKVIDAESSTYQPMSKESIQVPSPQEYLPGFFAYNAALWSITRCTGPDDRKERVFKEISKISVKNEDNIIENNWVVWCYLLPYIKLSLKHALMSEIRPPFRLSDIQIEEVQKIIENEIDADIRKLDKLRMTLKCITKKVWFEKQCLKLGPFYT